MAVSKVKCSECGATPANYSRGFAIRGNVEEEVGAPQVMTVHKPVCSACAVALDNKFLDNMIYGRTGWWRSDAASDTTYTYTWVGTRGLYGRR